MAGFDRTTHVLPNVDDTTKTLSRYHFLLAGGQDLQARHQRVHQPPADLQLPRAGVDCMLSIFRTKSSEIVFWLHVSLARKFLNCVRGGIK
jgi:hypothetical protein